ncbi:MAG: alpha/beta hydrolase [Verrucomicrobia bacterium]|nr:alpha/beta hydrolase [Verrucomicrobiota bacterium]
MLSNILITAVLGYTAMCVLLFLLQRRMLYYPSSTALAEQLAYAPGAGLEPWRDAAGARIGWKREAPGAVAAQRWLVFHGNAGLAVQRAYWADALERVSPGRTLSVYILEYPGYGRREGSPTENAITAAALAAIDAFPADGKPTHLLGESLGCAVAAQVARARPERVGGLVLVSPFNCLADVAAHHYPWLPVRGLLRDRWRSDEALRGFAGPVAILAAERDGVVPAKFAQRLHDGHPGRKRLHVIAGEDHNFFVFDQPWFGEAVVFATAE